MKSLIYVGLDVHKDSIVVAMATQRQTAVARELAGFVRAIAQEAIAKAA